MAIYRIAGDHVRPLDKTTFQAEGMLERQDLQRLFRQNIASRSRCHGAGGGIRGLAGQPQAH